MKLDQITDEVIDVPMAGKFLGLGRNASYEAAKRGEIPTIRLGKLLKVSVKRLQQKLAGVA